jgi:hypothetical protein
VGERFVSKRDGWLVAMLWGASLVDFAMALWLWLGFEAAPAFVAPLLVAAGAFQLHALYGTHYTLDADVLVIRASFFRWRVPVAQIDAIEPTRNPLSSPACSLDRLLLSYGKKHIMISPLDQAGFLRALAQRAPQLELQGEGAKRKVTEKERPRPSEKERPRP